MTSRLVECVPNFSEGRKPQVIDRIARTIETVESAVVLDTHIDPDHNRSVITFVAEPEFAVDAAVMAVQTASELIDLRHHSGEHPRLGATDVLPFVPVRGVSMDECVALAHRAGERIARELSIPVYFYERAAKHPDRVNLEDVRRGGYELLRTEIETVTRRQPDVGQNRIHESAGAVVVGARPFLIAFNVDIDTDDVSIAKRIAKAVRGRDGGLRYLKALGFELSTRGISQVSMNLVDFEHTSLHHAFEAVEREAERYGVRIVGSEIVGLVPQAALNRAAEYYLRVENFSPGVVLEERIAAAYAGKGEGITVRDFVEEVSSGEPTPGGGAVAAYAAALAVALGEMIGRLTLGRERYADVENHVREAMAELAPLRTRLQRAVIDDSASFQRVIEARRLSRAAPELADERSSRIEEALKSAATVPLEVAGAAVQALEVLETLAEIGNSNALSDAATGAQMALAAVTSARYNVLVNTSEIEDEEFKQEHNSRVTDLLDRAREIAGRVEVLFLESLKAD
jgi:glutamate formiminotransferase/formiminotetrahydrofolate cyclodeaminase